jgi:hypothetical protein
MLSRKEVEYSGFCIFRLLAHSSARWVEGKPGGINNLHSLFPDRALNLGRLEYEAGVLTTVILLIFGRQRMTNYYRL